MADLTLLDIDEKIRSEVKTQEYSEKCDIEDVLIIPLKNHSGETGDFGEILRFDENCKCDQIKNFKIAQINRSKILPDTIKAWHLHLGQDEAWYVAPSNHLIVGLWDVRKNSKTKGQQRKVVLGGNNSVILFIPKGVAHGCTNITKKPVDLYYFTSQVFNKENPDEKRIPWNAVGEHFWEPEKN